MKDGLYVIIFVILCYNICNIISLYDKPNKGRQWVSLFIDRNTTEYFDSLRIEYIPQEVLSNIHYSQHI